MLNISMQGVLYARAVPSTMQVRLGTNIIKSGEMGEYRKCTDVSDQ